MNTGYGRIEAVLDLTQVEQVKALRHRVGANRHRCRCPECTALIRICVLAQEAVMSKLSRSKAKRQEAR